jgi:hypothetical protein
MSCDDLCKFLMSTGADNTDRLSPEATEVLMDRRGHTSYRNYDNFESNVDAADFDAQSFSQWIELEEGQLYYIES